MEDMSRQILAEAIKEDVLFTATESAVSIQDKPKPKKRRLTKREKILQQELLKPTPIPGDDDLIKLRQRYDIKKPQIDGNTFHNVVRVYDQVISLRQELAELTEMVRELKEAR